MGEDSDLEDVVGRARAAVLARIEAASTAAGRAPGSVRLIAVSKQQDWARVEAALTSGQRAFGENRVQEGEARWAGRRGAWPGLELRLIGPLQTNKARGAVALFDAIDSLDRDKLARALADAVQEAGRSPDFLIQVNTGEEAQKAGEEAQKAGVLPQEADAFIRAARETYGLSVQGLMCIPPADEEPAPHFALLAKIAARNGLRELSMGMSGDFETAIRFGATMVRVGSLLFGARR